MVSPPPGVVVGVVACGVAADAEAPRSALAEVLRLIEQGHFSNGDGDLFRPLLENLTGRDPFCVLADFDAYMRAQDEVDLAWADRNRWNRTSLLNTARTGFFSSDRSIRDYVKRIWKAEPFPVTITCELD